MEKQVVTGAALISLIDVAQENVKRVGNKVLRLAQLVRQGYSVPPALILPSDLVAALWQDDTVVVSDHFLDDIWQQYQIQLGKKPFIVRSSGREDGEDLSFAGQFDSVPDISTKEELRQALIACISSSRSDGLRLYHKTAGALAAEDCFAVMVMPQRTCIFAGIMFSHMHLNGDSDGMVVIQLARGSNFGLTSGSEVGDIIYLEKDTGNLLWSIPDEPTVKECSDDNIDGLYSLALNLETTLGFAVDVEWGVLQNGTIEIFQVRPITSKGGAGASDLRLRVILQSLKTMNSAVARLQQHGVGINGNWWSDQNIAELITDNPSRMAFGIFTYIFAHGQGAIRQGRNEMGYNIGAELEGGFFELIGGRPRCSIAHDALTYRIKGIPLDDYAAGIVQRYLSQISQDVQLANYPEVVLYEQNPSLEFLTDIFGKEKGKAYALCYEKFFSNIRTLEGAVSQEFVRVFEPAFRHYIDEQRVHINSLLSSTEIPELVASCRASLDHLRTVSCVMFVKVARLGFFAYARLRRRLEGTFGETEGRHLLDQMTAGLEDDSSMLFNVRLSEHRDGKISLQELIDEFGHLGPNELEIANPRYRNQVNLIERLASNIRGNPAEELSSRANQARQITQSIISSFTMEEASELQKDLIVARRYLALRERVKYYYLMEYDCLRQILVRIAELIGIEEHFIFELDPRELDLVLTNPNAAVALVKDRYQERSLLDHIHIPPVLSQESVGEIGRESYNPEAKVLMGIGVTPFITRSRVVVILDPHDTRTIAKLVPGSVLVTKTTDPTWAPIIAAVGGNGALVTEIGGPLAHGAIVARDLGIACVQNVSGVTKRFKTGDLVEVDGKNGAVTLIEESQQTSI